MVINKHDLSPMGNVTAKVFDAGGKLVYGGTTTDDGTINYVPLMWKAVKNQETRTFTPHRIFITKGNASANVTGINMSVNQNIVIPFDDSPPGLTITYPPDGMVTNQSVIQVTGAIDTDSTLTLNGQAISANGGDFNITFWLEEGDNTLRFKGTDSFGNIVDQTRHVILMTVPPSLEITEPEEGAATNLKPILVKGWTNGSKVEINGNPVNLGAAGNFTYYWQPQNEGKQMLTAVARDAAGNSRVLKRSVIYDITPPKIEIVSPANGSWLNIPTVDITIRLPDSVSAKIEGTTNEPGTGGNITFRKLLSDGENRISIAAWDKAGNMNGTTLVLNLDTANFLDVTEPGGDIIINKTQISVGGKTEPGATVTVNGMPVENRNGDFSLSLTLTEGMNKITAVSIDRAGNRAEKIFRITVDTIPPQITILSPLESVSNVAKITIIMKSEKDANVTANGFRVTGSGDAYDLDVILIRGDNRFVISARDMAGNTNTTEMVISYVPPKPPLPTPTTENNLFLPAAVIIIVVSILLAAYIMVHRKKGRR